MKMNFKEFWKYYSYSIVRIFVDQIAIAIFGLAMALGTSASVSSLGDEKARMLTVITSIFAILFFLFMVAELCFRHGASDKEKTDNGRMQRNNLTGLYMGLLANVPNFILTLGYTVFYFIEATRGSVSGVFGLITKLMCGEYLGLFSIKIGDSLLSSYPP
ncbi:MAG: hypothetical protein IJZ89_06385, partial [Clostridia bacterium]|nr:hypothetical protein [Clostridia bacterium]